MHGGGFISFLRSFVTLWGVKQLLTVHTRPDESLSDRNACISVVQQIVELQTDGVIQNLLKDVTLNPLFQHTFVFASLQTTLTYIHPSLRSSKLQFQPQAERRYKRGFKTRHERHTCQQDLTLRLLHSQQKCVWSWYAGETRQQTIPPQSSWLVSCFVPSATSAWEVAAGAQQIFTLLQNTDCNNQ